jgi:hypothetical protein
MQMLSTLITFAIFLLLGCSSKEEEAVAPMPASSPAPVVKVEAPETAQKGESVAVKFYFLVNNGCGEFGSLEAEQSGTTVTVTVYPHYREGFCTQAITTREAIYTFKPENSGTYTLKFWAGNAQYITETIVVQ